MASILSVLCTILLFSSSTSLISKTNSRQLLSRPLLRLCDTTFKIALESNYDLDLPSDISASLKREHEEDITEAQFLFNRADAVVFFPYEAMSHFDLYMVYQYYFPGAIGFSILSEFDITTINMNSSYILTTPFLHSLNFCLFLTKQTLYDNSADAFPQLIKRINMFIGEYHENLQEIELNGRIQTRSNISYILVTLKSGVMLKLPLLTERKRKRK
jgi:hypothetical protein